MTFQPDPADELACTRLMIAASRYADLHDDDAFLALFTADGTVSRLGETFSGQAQIRDFLNQRKRERRTRHVLSPVLIEFSANDTASGVAMFTLFDGVEDGRDVLTVDLPATVGEFRQTYRKIDGRWKIATHAAAGAFRRATK